jgi:nucleoside-diphosphate-sugar epimerase
VRALVTGGAGFLGGHLVEELERRGDEVSALVRPSSSAVERLRGQGVGVVGADLRRPGPAFPSELAGFDAVYHLAAGVGAGWRATFDNNVTATENLLDALAEGEWRGRFVHVSSFAVYGANQLPAGSVLDESAPLEPEPGKRDDYAWTKLLQERLVRERLEGAAGVELVVVRPGAIYGPGRPFQYRLGRPLGEQAVLLLGGGNRMPLNYVENTASLLAECGHNPAAAGQTFNAVDPDPVKQRDYLRAWKRSDPDLKVIPFPLWAYRLIGRMLKAGERRTGGRTAPPLFLDPYVMEPSLRRFRYDGSRATSVLGWTPPVSAAEGLERTFPPSSRS